GLPLNPMECEKSRELLSSYWATCSRPGCPRLRLYRTGCARVPGPSGRDHLALCRRNDPVALYPPPSELMARQSPAVSPAHAPPEPQPDHTRRSAQTPGVGALSELGPRDQWGVAQCHRCRPVWDLESLL